MNDFRTIAALIFGIASLIAGVVLSLSDINGDTAFTIASMMGAYIVGLHSELQDGSDDE